MPCAWRTGQKFQNGLRQTSFGQWVVNFTQGGEPGEPQVNLTSALWKQIFLLTKEAEKAKAYLAGQPIASRLGHFAARLWELLRDVNGTLAIWPDSV